MSQIEKLIEKMRSKPTPKNVTMQEYILYVKYYGYKLDRIKGSHHIFYNEKYNLVLVVPTIGGKYIKPIYIDQVNSCIKEMEVEEDE